MRTNFGLYPHLHLLRSYWGHLQWIAQDQTCFTRFFLHSYDADSLSDSELLLLLLLSSELWWSQQHLHFEVVVFSVDTDADEVASVVVAVEVWAEDSTFMLVVAAEDAFCDVLWTLLSDVENEFTDEVSALDICGDVTELETLYDTDEGVVTADETVLLEVSGSGDEVDVSEKFCSTDVEAKLVAVVSGALEEPENSVVVLNGATDSVEELSEKAEMLDSAEGADEVNSADVV